MSAETTINFYPKREIATDSGDHTTYTLRGYSGQASPAPKVYVNGVLKTVTTDYTFSNGNTSTHCSITFTGAQAAADVVTCSYKWQWACTGDQDFSVYSWDRPSNAKNEVDVNGHSIISEGYNKHAAFHGTLAWAYIPFALYTEIKTIAENRGGTIDVIRASLSAPFASLTNLAVVSWPAWAEVPGVPGYAESVQIDVVQVA